MAAGTYNITIEQGSTFRRTVTWKDGIGNPINLTGYTARLQARVAPDSVATVINLTTENGGIILGGVAGTVQLYLTATQTAALTIKAAQYQLELVQTSTGDVTRLLKGKVKLDLEVAK